MRKGKLTNEELNSCLSVIKNNNEDLVALKGGIGEDCAVVKGFGDMLVTSDPITAETENAGELAMRVSANDIYSSGGIPLIATLTVIVPPTSETDRIAKIISDAERVAEELGITIVGGHTEFSDSVVREIVSVTMIGKPRGKDTVSTGGGKEGDTLFMTKYAAIEGTTILAARHKELIDDRDREELDTVNSSLSIAKDSMLAVEAGVHAMHDVTEGGVFGAVCEMAAASGVGALVSVKDIPVLNVTRKLAKRLKISPMRLISSGSLLIATDDADRLKEAFRGSGILLTEIGRLGGEKTVADHGDRLEEISVTADELFTAEKEGMNL